jgi:lipoic acid synthetase
LYRRVRPKARYARSLELLRRAKEMAPDRLTKSGIMVGLGETVGEILETMADIRAAAVDILTVGQYLRPSKENLPVEKYYTPDEFRFFREQGLKMGFRHVESGPLVRSSYHAREQVDALGTRGHMA